ncbi:MULTISPECIES: DUF2062 domain-containing protein [Prochlorococcus]|uniref:Uncharacterized conserved protein n=1 Tax=Prochlorococcus marinus (strain SARG / CCMP1375 / SS120) TaxID=167539 RepID=Q7VE00_PROMA|nr:MULTISPECIES: DUF2062 domain-containing protein [Prochlorococcus]AAP99261.1 Uncharacterized conserved protein [Prochlorococcus marinus subsp. marinus str. CCMP1375]KGG22850.1 hypothetical protein EV09_1591 [Prochlorococcus marinus str. SS35]
MIRILRNIIKRVRSLSHWIWKQEGTPAKRARGVAIGIFSGCFPFFGFQSLIGICLASLFKANHLLAIMGTWISNPFTYIPLYWMNYKVGSYFLGSDATVQVLSNVKDVQIWHQGWNITMRILFGSTIVGFSSGIVMGSLFYFLSKIVTKKNI